MNNVIIATDFSGKSKHAAHYGYALARQIKSNVILCNAMIVPAEIPQAGLIMWPANEYDALLDDSQKELEHLKKKLEASDTIRGFKPLITYVSEAGTVNSVVDNILTDNETELVVIGTHRHNGIGEILLNNHASTLIDNLTKPLLLVSAEAQFKPVKKIAFATDLQNIATDLLNIYQLIPFARKLGAEILLTHITKERHISDEHQQLLSKILVDLSNKADYPDIYYRLIINQNAETGLDQLCEHGQVDMLAMVHRHSGFFDRLFGKSYAHKMARHIHIPLLVLPAGA